MGIRMSGLNSGLDTETIVNELMKAKRIKQTKIENKKSKLEWKKEKWDALNTKIYGFYKDSLGKMRMQGTYKTKSTTSSDTSKLTATATSATTEGTYRVKINSLASAQYVTGATLNQTTDGKKVSTKTKLTELADASGNATFTEGTQITIKGSKGTSTLLIEEGTTVNDFLSKCSKAGVNASFDTTQQRFFLSSEKSGLGNEFQISSAALSSSQLDAIHDFRDAVGYEYLSATDKSAVDAIMDKMQTGAMASPMPDATREKLEAYIEKASKNGVKSYYKKKLTDDYKSRFFEDADATIVSAAGRQALIDSGKTAEQVDGMSATARAKAMNALITKNVNNDLASPTYAGDTGLIAQGINNGINPVAEPGAPSFLTTSMNDRKANMTALAETFHDSVDSSTLTDNSAQLAGMGIGQVTGAEVAAGAAGANGMVVTAASDAEIEFNGATMTSSTSTITINGLTLNLLSETAPGSEVTVSVTKDTTGVYDSIKDFLSEYNAVLKEMNTAYNAASAKGYQMLTDEQKEAMTDSQVDKWESKIKDSLLRRDDSLSSVISSFRTKMTGVSITASDGKRYSLANLGITTSTDYKEGGLLHIKGDEDDGVFSDEENKLEKMLQEKPDIVMEVITSVTKGLYEELQKKMQRTNMSSALTFYNDKEMNTQLSAYKKEIAKWETKLAAMENRYYKQFTAMEKAMASMNSQQNSLSSMMGR